jgi:hypothetical protein
MKSYKIENIEKVLSQKCFKDVGFNGTLRQFMGKCLINLFEQGEAFTGKQPIYNSKGWQGCAASACAILEPGIGRWVKDGRDPDYVDFEVLRWGLYQNTLKKLIEYVFQKRGAER